jgi:hypothetical protein
VNQYIKRTPDAPKPRVSMHHLTPLAMAQLKLAAQKMRIELATKRAARANSQEQQA